MATINVWDERIGLWVSKPLKKYSSGWELSTYNVNNGSWESSGDTDNFVPNYSMRDPSFKYKWGYNLLLKEDNKDALIECYTRIYNAVKYNDSVSSYYVKNFSTGDKTKVYDVTVTYTCNIIVTTYQLDSLKLYLEDIGLSSTDLNIAKGAFEEDYPELLYKWCWSNLQSKYLPLLNSSSCVSYILLPYHKASTRKSKLYDCNSSFRTICELVKDTYGIEFIDQAYELNNKHYTELEKVKVSKVIHDYIVSHSKYGNSSTAAGGSQEMWAALSNYKYDPVCASYARAFQYCAWRWGITCINVNGACEHDSRDGLHAWDMLTYKPYTFLDSEIYDNSIWYEMDLTWDDPTWGSDDDGNEIVYNNYIRWKYYNCSASWLYSNADGTARHRSELDTTSDGVEIIKSYPVDTNGASIQYWWQYDSSLGYSPKYSFNALTDGTAYAGF